MAEADFFFNTKRSVSRIDGIEIYHPSFSRTFYFVRNPNPWMKTQPLGHGDGTVHVYEYLPMRLRPMTTQGDLDFGVTIDLGDLGELLPAEIDRMVAAGTTNIRPDVTYRVWRSDRLNAPMDGPFRLQVVELSRNKEGSSFDAVAPYLNRTKTGELMTIDRFPMLRGEL